MPKWKLFQQISLFFLAIFANFYWYNYVTCALGDIIPTYIFLNQTHNSICLFITLFSLHNFYSVFTYSLLFHKMEQFCLIFVMLKLCLYCKIAPNNYHFWTQSIHFLASKSWRDSLRKHLRQNK